MDSNILTQLYTKYAGTSPDGNPEALASSGSNRRYFRLRGNPTLIGVIGTCRPENDAFLYLADHFAQRGIPVPRVVAVSDDRMSYLQEDLGDTLLFNAIEKGRLTSSFSNAERDLLIQTIQLLPDIQFNGAVGLDFYRSKRTPEILVKVLYNGHEASLPIPQVAPSFYSWTAFKDYYRNQNNF